MILVHGEEAEMARMAAKLKDDLAGELSVNVCAPQNCQTIQLSLSPDLHAEAVGSENPW